MTPIAQFDVYPVRGEAARLAPFVVVVQANVLASLKTVVVIPLQRPEMLPSPIEGLHVPVRFNDADLVVATEHLVSLPRAMLGTSVGSLASDEYAIKRAIDVLFFGI